MNLFSVDGPDHDTFIFAASDFGGSVAAELHGTHNAKGGAVIVASAMGGTLKLQGISKAQPAQNAGDIAFHP